MGTVTGTGINCGLGGSDCTESYASGTSVTLIATPAENLYRFVSWGSGCDSPSGNTCTVIMNESKTVTAEFGYVTPPTVAGSDRVRTAYGRHMSACSRLYAKLLEEGVPPEDARFVLPNATETKILVSMNARELHHFFALRTCRRAQWEIRGMAMRMLSIAKDRAPLLFETAGPGCVRGRCPEGKMSCGKQAEVRAGIAALGKEAGI